MTAPALQQYIQGQGAVSADNLNTFQQTCDTAAQLRGLIGLPGMQVYIRGIASVGDGLAGTFYWSASAVGPDDNLNTIVPTGAGSGAWIRSLSSSSGLSYLAPYAGAVSRSVNSKESDYTSVKDFGVTGNGTTDDTTAAALAIATAETNGLSLYWPAGRYKLSAPLQITGKIHMFGAGLEQTTLFCTTNYSTILHYTSTAAGAYVENLALDSTNTTTQLMRLDQGSQVLDFFCVQFGGNLPGDLIYSQASGFVEFLACVWGCNALATNGLTLDGFNENCSVTRCHAGGPGNWIVIENSSIPANAVQGFRLSDSTSICTGSNPIEIGGGAFLTQIFNNILDQGSANGIVLASGATFTQIENNWIGLGASSTGSCVLVTSVAAFGVQINGNTTFGGSNAIAVQASASARVAGVQICNNVFSSAAVTTLSLDSVNGCIVENNTDLSLPTNGSWSTSGTNAAGGAYTFGGNSWAASSPANFHATSSYRADFDRGGILLKNQGTVTSPSGTSVTFAHGLVSTPDQVFITQVGGGGMTSNAAFTSTSITIGYSTAGAATFSWQASVNR